MIAPLVPFDQLPFSEDMERAVLGALLAHPHLVASVTALLQPDDFYLMRHELIYRALLAQERARQPLEVLGLQQRLKAAGKLDDVGGVGYLLDIAGTWTPEAYVVMYAQLVQRMALRRRMMRVGVELHTLALNEAQPVEWALAEAQRLFNSLHGALKSDPSPSLQAIMNSIFDEIEVRMENNLPPGIPTGLRDVDELLCGFRPGQSIYLAGRPGMGKTAWMLTVMLHQARAGRKVGICTMEMSREELGHRLLSMETQVDVQRLMTAHLTPDEVARVTKALPKWSSLPILIDDRTAQTPDTIRARALQWKHEGGLDVLFIDYLGLMVSGVQRLDAGESRTAQISDITRRLKMLARDLEIPVVCAAQLNRDVEHRKDKRPQLSDLRDSGTIEQDADVILFLFREGYYDDTVVSPNATELIVAKQRSGPTGTVMLHFERALTRFTSAQRRYIDLSELSESAHDDDA